MSTLMDGYDILENVHLMGFFCTFNCDLKHWYEVIILTSIELKWLYLLFTQLTRAFFFYQGRKVKITNNNIISELYGYIVPSQKGDALLSCGLFFFIFFFRFFFRFSCTFCPVHNFLSFDIDFWYSKIPHSYVPFWWPLILTLYVKVK